MNPKRSDTTVQVARLVTKWFGNRMVTKLFSSIRRWTKVTETVTETTHKVTKLTTNKEYTFRVTAVNEEGPGETSPKSPYVKISKPSTTVPPVVLEPLKDIVVGLKETVTLSCIIGGTPMPEITWYRLFI